jgi:site-specific recombinase XerD
MNQANERCKRGLKADFTALISVSALSYMRLKAIWSEQKRRKTTKKLQRMARVRFYRDKRATKEGKHHIKILISHHTTTALLSTGVLIHSDQWNAGDTNTDPHIKRACPGYKVLNDILSCKLEAVQGQINALVLNGTLRTFKTATHIKNRIQAQIDGKDGEDGLVATHFKKFITRRNKAGTANAYKETLVKIAKYSDIDRLRFEEITVAWLKNFETKLRRDGLAVNSVARHLRDIRAVYNDAIDYDVASLADYPFRRFKITHEATAKRSLTIDRLRQFRDFPCEPHKEKYRDLFMLIFYLGGINLVDLCHLTEINNGRIEYKRAKTSSLYSIKVEPEAQAIIDKYRGESHLLFPLDKYADHKDFLHRMNLNLKEIGTVDILQGRGGKKEKTGLFPDLSTYWARHSWASIAAELEIPIETISAMLGHRVGSKVTSVYVAFNRKKIDEANRRVIDFLHES